MSDRFHPAAATQALAWLGVLAAAALMAARGWSTFSVSEPLMVITSGTDEETALILWKYVHGERLYSDPNKFPFTATYYNWLFYVFYGTLSGAVVKLLALDIAWLPVIGRWISLGWTVLGFAGGVAILRDATAPDSLPRRLALPYAAFVFFGPLVGFWAFALNVEIAATVCGVLATLAFVRLYDNAPVRATLLACLLAYAAWSFKQSHVMIVGALGLFLLIRRDWRCLAIVCVTQWGGWGAALAIGSEAYVKTLLFIGTDKTLEFPRFLVNLTNLVSKTTPILALSLVALPALFGTSARRAAIVADKHALISLCGLFVSALITIPFSAKQGAGENYYFLLTFFMVYAALALLRSVPAQRAAGLGSSGVLMVGWLAGIAAIVSVFLGVNGRISVQNWHDKNLAQSRCLAGMPSPLLPVANPYMALPWATQGEPRFSISYNYPRDRSAGRWFEQGGFGGLVERGYFGTIILAPGATPSFDGADLTGRYRLAKANCAGIDIYVRAADGGS